MIQPNLFSYEEQPISVKSCIVDIAHSYTKKKNVFCMKRYNGSEYLFQADDHEEMISWIEAIKSNSNADEGTQGITSEELIIRKSQEMDESAALVTKTSPPQSQKMTKNLSVLSIKQKVLHSPNLKRQKTTSDKAERPTATTSSSQPLSHQLNSTELLTEIIFRKNHRKLFNYHNKRNGKFTNKIHSSLAWQSFCKEEFKIRQNTF